MSEVTGQDPTLRGAICDRHGVVYDGLLCEECRDEVRDRLIEALASWFRPKIRQYRRRCIRVALMHRPWYVPRVLWRLMVRWRVTRQLRLIEVLQSMWQRTT